MELKAIVAQNIRIMRLKNNLSQSELAQQCRVSQSAISKIERAESLPSSSLIEKMSELFQVEQNSFFRKDIELAIDCELALKTISDKLGYDIQLRKK